MTTPHIIDTRMHGRDGITACFLIQAQRTALVETGPQSSVANVVAELDSMGIDHIDDIVVTHIHLDHAGAAGTMARRFPGATVWVHPIGAPHLADPTKLWNSAGRIYGDQMEELWGGIEPIPADRIKALEDGAVVDLGDRHLTAFETAGHAYHHHAYLDSGSGTLFTGDALGVRLPDLGLVRPATPPPEFHLEKAIESIERIRSLRPEALWLTHFGPHDEGKGALTVDEMCSHAAEALNSWAEWTRGARAQTDDLEEAAALVGIRAREAFEHDLGPEAVDRLEHTSSYWMNTWGYFRYFDKHEDAPG